MIDNKAFHQALSQTMLRDRYRLSQMFKGIQGADSEEKHYIQFLKYLEKSKSEYLSRKLLTDISYDTNLPISESIEAIKHSLESHQVLVIGGETGSGKSTQLPKICLELGLSQAGMIAHTQPRRIAARAISQRVSEELCASPELAAIEGLVACKVRFSDGVKKDTHIKLMTDGMLLAEIKQDPFLEHYQCIIVDEVHERSLNIDFLLAYLKRLIKKRKDLKIILTSATVDLKRFSQHFDDAPILEIEGRSFPVEIQYRDPDQLEDDQGEKDQLIRILEELIDLFSFKIDASDVLFFLPTEQEIRQHSKNLRKYFEHRLDIIPLYGRMPLSQQRQVFTKTSNKRRVVLATNVAETSITVPNIGFVIDTGLARISRYSTRTKVQQLPIEKISQSSAQQRAGRCGRVASGVCLRLYSEEDFLSRETYTQPEIQRTNLASVVLKLKSMKLGTIDDFPLLDKPDSRLVKDAVRLLYELKAIDEKENLTIIGKKLSLFSIDPRYARMLVEAHERHCLEEMLIIVSGLSVNDPRLRPHEFQKKADESHLAYADSRSDFYSYLRMWVIVEENRQALSGSQFRKYCEKNFLSWPNLNEWRELHHQLVLQCRQAGFKVSQWSLETSDLNDYLGASEKVSSDYMNIHKSLLSGCLSQIAKHDEGHVYQGIHHRQVFIFPASNLMSQQAPWIMSSQLIETTKLYAHCCARIEAGWLVEIGSHILKKHYFDAFWSKRQACVQVYRQLSLSGLVVEAKKAVKVSSENKRFIQENIQEIFIRGALIERRYHRAPTQVKQNWDYLDALNEEEQKVRFSNLLPDEGVLLAFYQKRIPDSIWDVRSFEHWLKQQQKSVLWLDDSVLSLEDERKEIGELYPDFISFDDLSIPCEYLFDTASEWDGLSIKVPYDQLNQLSTKRLDWLVPGMIEEKCLALLKSLPKSLRKQCLPLADTVKICLAKMDFAEGSLFESLAVALHKTKGIQVNGKDFQRDQIPSFLKAHIIVLDENNKLLTKGNDLEKIIIELRARFKNDLSIKSFSDSLQKNDDVRRSVVDKQRFTRWDFGDLDEFVFVERKGLNNEHYQLKLFQALKDEKDAVSIALFDNSEEAQHCHRKGQRRLIQLSLSAFRKDFRKRLNRLDEKCIQLFSAGGKGELFADLFDALIDAVFFSLTDKALYPTSLVYKQEDFENTLRDGQRSLFISSQEFMELFDKIAGLVFQLRQALAVPVSDLRKRHHHYIEAHLNALIYPGFLSDMPIMILKRYPVYVQGMLIRLERLQGNIDRDEQNQEVLDGLYYRMSSIPVKTLSVTQLANFWKIRRAYEEFSLILFAQDLRAVNGTSFKAIDELLKHFDV